MDPFIDRDTLSEIVNCLQVERNYLDRILEDSEDVDPSWRAAAEERVSNYGRQIEQLLDRLTDGLLD